MRWLTVLALLGAAACAPAQRERPATVVVVASETRVVAVSTPTVPLGDLDAFEPTAPDSGERAKAKAAVAGQREFAQPVVPPEETVVRVLLYHGIGPSSSRESVKTRAFREQIEWLGAHGIEVIRLGELLEFLDGELWLPRHAVVITIDDGESNGYSARPEAFFYPLGDQNYRIRRLTKLSGYRAAFVAHGGPTVVGTRRFGIPRYDVKPDTSLRTFRSFFNHGIPVLRAAPR